MSQAHAKPRVSLPGVDVLPRHIAIIMDGNGRWARRLGQPRSFGHAQGARAVRPIVTECARLGIEYLTLYSFSTENWSRSVEEVDFLMDLYVEYLRAERPTMMENNIRFLQIGRREGLNPRLLEELDRTIEMTRTHTGLSLVLAVNYGARTELVDAVRALAREVRSGQLDPQAIDENTIASHLYTQGFPDPDLLLRTAGEMRVSNYLLWQISYAEIAVSPVCWPEFTVTELHAVLREFSQRKRTFGGVPAPANK